MADTKMVTLRRMREAELDPVQKVAETVSGQFKHYVVVKTEVPDMVEVGWVYEEQDFEDLLQSGLSLLLVWGDEL